MVIDVLTPKELTVYMIGAAIAPPFVIFAVLYWRRVPRFDLIVAFGVLWMAAGIVLELITPRLLPLFAAVIALAPLVIIGVVINFKRWGHLRSRSNSKQILSWKKSNAYALNPAMASGAAGETMASRVGELLDQPFFAYLPKSSNRGIYFERRVRFASRTPAPPPFSGINSTPAFSSALAIFAMVSSATLIEPPASARLRVGTDIPAASATSAWDIPVSARAALNWKKSTKGLDPFRSSCMILLYQERNP
jgi:hypothetical protein